MASFTAEFSHYDKEGSLDHDMHYFLSPVQQQDHNFGASLKGLENILVFSIRVVK